MKLVFNIGLVIGVALSPPVWAGCIHGKIRNSLVYVVAKAVNLDQGNIEVAARSTGFYINTDGNIATSRHVISKLGRIDEETLRLFVVPDSFSDREIDASVDWDDKLHDLLILRIPTAGHKVAPPQFASNAKDGINLGDTKVCTSGFPEGFSYMTDDGTVRSFDGPTGRYQYLWVTNMEFKEGQSGSPVYMENGQVIGVAKGSERDLPRNTFFVPLRYFPYNYIAARDVNRTTEFASNKKLSEPVTVALTAEVLDQKRIVTTRSVPYLMTGEHCASPQRMVSQIEATAGWSIDPKSISVEAKSQLGASYFEFARPKDAQTIEVASMIGNAGNCVEIGDKKIQNDVKGFVAGTIKFSEFKDEIVPVTKKIVQGNVTSTSTIVLPENIDVNKLSVEIANSKSKKVLTGDALINGSSGVKLIMNSGSNALTIQ